MSKPDPAPITAAPPEKPRRKATLITIAILGALVLVLGAVIVTLLITGGAGDNGPLTTPTATRSANSTPTPSASPSVTPTPAETTQAPPPPAPPPAPPAPAPAVINYFGSVDPAGAVNAGCSAAGASAFTLLVQWQSSVVNNSAVLYVDGGNPAGYASGLPSTGSYEIVLACPGDNVWGAIEVTGDDGVVVRSETQLTPQFF